MSVAALSADQFEEKVLHAVRPVVIDVWAPWCGPCRAMAPHFEAAAAALGEQADFFKLNADENQALLREYKIMGIPTVLYFSHGRLVDRKSGVQSVVAISRRVEPLLGLSAEAAAQREVKGWLRWPFGRRRW